MMVMYEARPNAVLAMLNSRSGKLAGPLGKRRRKKRVGPSTTKNEIRD